MKRLLLFCALALVATAGIVHAQGSNQRRVLFEEFTNTGCPPCAATDPMVEEFQSADMSNICVLKYHTSWPDPSDPFYLYTKSVEGSKGIDPRILGYYIPGISGGVPYTRFSGAHGGYTTAFSVSDEMTVVADSVNALKSPYKMSVVQSMTADSIIATVTVEATDDVPSLTDLRLAVVFAEQYNPYHGTNGRPYHTNIVRRV